MRHVRILFVVVLFLLFFSTTVYAVKEEGQMKIYAVTTEGEGLVASLYLNIEPGDGTVWSAVVPLVGTTTQDAERTAVKVAGNYSTEAKNYDYKFRIQSDASVVEGPSAGAAMALLTIILLRDTDFPINVSITGTITQDGFVGAVGGVYEKAKEASMTGIELFMIPKGEAKQTVKENGEIKSVNLVEYAPTSWGMKVLEVATIDEALEYALSDIGTLDINTDIASAFPDFIPERIGYGEYLQPMKELTGNYLIEANQKMDEARTALSTTLIENSDVVKQLYEILTVAEGSVKRAQILYGQNYLYTAANSAFVAKVNASLIADISNNPALLELDSTALRMKLNDLESDIFSLKREIDDVIMVDTLEYYIAAKQRLMYAKNNVDLLLTTQTVIIGGSEAERLSAAVFEVLDYEYAFAWYEIAEDMFEISKSSERRAYPDDAFAMYMDDFLEEAEIAIEILDEEAAEDVIRRIDAAVSAKLEEWYLASSFDAVTALALIEGEFVVEGQDLNSLYSIFREKLSELEESFLESEYEFLWAQLYFDHAKNYLAEADYYYENGRGADTVTSLKNGIGLLYLAEYLLLVSEDVYDYYASFSPEDFVTDGPRPNGNGKPQNGDLFDLPKEWYYGLVALIAVCILIIVIVFVLSVTVLKPKPYRRYYSIPIEIGRVREQIHKVDNAFMERKITREEHDMLITGYIAELRDLEQLRLNKIQHLFEMDEVGGKLAGYQHQLQELKEHYRCGLLLPEEFAEKSARCLTQIEELKKMLGDENLELTIEKAKFLAHMDRKRKRKKKTKKPAKGKNKKKKTS